MHRSFKTEGIIIKRRNIGEADRFLTVFTKNHGKITVKAVGVRRIMSRRSPHVELLNHAALTLYKGNGHALPILTETESLEDFSSIKKDLTKIGFAYHICELVDGLCPENQENRAVFSLLYNMLCQLAYCHSGEQSESRISSTTLRESDSGQARMTASLDVITLIHDFEIELLTLLGYWPARQSFAQANAGGHRPQVLSKNLNTQYFIEGILERKLRSKTIFSKL